MVNSAIIRHGKRDEALGVAREEILVIIEVLVELLSLDGIRHLGGVDTHARAGECGASRVRRWWDVVLGRVVVLRRRLGRRGLAKMRAMRSGRLVLLLRWGIRPTRRRRTAVIDLVQLWSARVDIWLLVLAVRRVVGRLLLAIPRRERWVVRLDRGRRDAGRGKRLPLLPLLPVRRCRSREGWVDGVS